MARRRSLACDSPNARPRDEPAGGLRTTSPSSQGSSQCGTLRPRSSTLTPARTPTTSSRSARPAPRSSGSDPPRRFGRSERREGPSGPEPVPAVPGGGGVHGSSSISPGRGRWGAGVSLSLSRLIGSGPSNRALHHPSPPRSCWRSKPGSRPPRWNRSGSSTPPHEAACSPLVGAGTPTSRRPVSTRCVVEPRAARRPSRRRPRSDLATSGSSRGSDILVVPGASAVIFLSPPGGSATQATTGPCDRVGDAIAPFIAHQHRDRPPQLLGEPGGQPPQRPRGRRAPPPARPSASRGAHALLRPGRSSISPELRAQGRPISRLNLSPSPCLLRSNPGASLPQGRLTPEQPPPGRAEPLTAAGGPVSPRRGPRPRPTSPWQPPPCVVPGASARTATQATTPGDQWGGPLPHGGSRKTPYRTVPPRNADLQSNRGSESPD